MEKIWVVLSNAMFSFIYLFIISKILGKKQIAELSFTDYVVGISIGSIAAEWSTDVKKPWFYYVIAMGVFVLISLIIDFLERKSNFFKRILKGKPLILIENGKIDYKNIKKSKLEINDILGLSRLKGFFNIDEIAFAFFETNGELSILPKSNYQPLTNESLNIEKEPSSLTNYIIVDGQFNKTTLNKIGKDKSYFIKKLKIKNKKKLKNIFLASYDEKNNTINIYKKDDLK